MKKQKKFQYTLIKIGLTLVSLYVVFMKVDFNALRLVLNTSKYSFLGIALIFFILSQWVSADRLLLIFKVRNIYLSKKSNYVLYLIGMFYNFFIPGGIGGDAYKVYVLHKTFRWPVKKLAAAVFIDRITGLVAIGSLCCLLVVGLIWSNDVSLPRWLPFVAFVVGSIAFYGIMRKWFPLFIKGLPKALFLSVIIQSLQLACVVGILMSISNTTNYGTYALIFLISSALSIFSFSGIGIREFIFYQAAVWFNFDPTLAVAVGLLFSCITILVSFSGIFLHIRTPKLQRRAHWEVLR